MPAFPAALMVGLSIVRSHLLAMETVQEVGNTKLAFTVEDSTWKTLA